MKVSIIFMILPVIIPAIVISTFLFSLKNKKQMSVESSIRVSGIFRLLFSIIWCMITLSILFILKEIVSNDDSMFSAVFLIIPSIFLVVGIILFVTSIKSIIHPTNINKENNVYNYQNNVSFTDNLNDNKEEENGYGHPDDDFFVRYCSSCGEQLKRSDQFCPSCGQKVESKK